MSKAYTHKVTKLPDSKIKVEVSVSKSEYDRFHEEAFAELSQDVKIAGFRPGKAPRAQIEAKIGNEVFSLTIRKLLSNTAADIIDSEGLNPLTQVEYDLTKASDTEVEFNFEFINYPEIKLGDLSKLKFNTQPVEVKPEEINEVIENLFKAKEDTASDGQTEADDKSEPKAKKIKAADVTDEMVAGLDIPDVTNVEQLHAHIVDRLTVIKQQSAENNALEDLIHQAIDVSEIPVPEALVAETADRQVNEYINRIQDLNVNVEEFLQAQGKDKDKLRQEKIDSAKHQLQHEFLMTEVVRKFELMPTPEDIEKEINVIQNLETRAQYDSPEGRRYIISMLIQQRAVDKLRELAAKQDKPKSEAKPSKK